MEQTCSEQTRVWSSVPPEAQSQQNHTISFNTHLRIWNVVRKLTQRIRQKSYSHAKQMIYETRERKWARECKISSLTSLSKTLITEESCQAQMWHEFLLFASFPRTRQKHRYPFLSLCKTYTSVKDIRRDTDLILRKPWLKINTPCTILVCVSSTRSFHSQVAHRTFTLDSQVIMVLIKSTVEKMNITSGTTPLTLPLPTLRLAKLISSRWSLHTQLKEGYVSCCLLKKNPTCSFVCFSPLITNESRNKSINYKANMLELFKMRCFMRYYKYF